jgi:UDP-N-acetylmuramoylalanine--D-glutamate ligase
MLEFKNIFFKKNILIYGLGKSGISSYEHLKKDNNIYLFDDKKYITKNIDVKKKLITKKDINVQNLDYIILSPGININKCSLSKFLKKNIKKINTDFL